MMIVTLMLFLSAQCSCSGVPVVQQMVGSFEDSAVVTVTGCCFGSKATAAPNLWDTVENQPAYAGLSDGSVIPVSGGAPWGERQAFGPEPAKYESSDVQRGTSSAFYKASRMVIGDRPVPGAQQLYLSWWEKSSINFCNGNHSSKVLRLNGNAKNIDGGAERLSWTQQEFYVYDNNYLFESWKSLCMIPNKWTFFEIYADQRGKRYWARVDNEPYFLETNVSGRSWDWTYVWRIGFDEGGVSPPGPVISVDDVYVDSTQARVMIGNASSYDASAALEMQIPTAWSDTAVSFRVNVGALGGEDVFVYVFDRDNNVSQGLAVPANGGTAPDAPANLRVRQQ